MTDDDFDFTLPADKKPTAANSPPAAVAVVTAPAKSQFYDKTLARALFESASPLEIFSVGSHFFVEHEQAAKGGFFSKPVPNRMYFVVAGEVTLTANDRVLDTIRADEIFGEMAVITSAPRSATATAKTDCQVYSLDATQFQSALQKTSPEFALMLMSVMFDRLRLVGARLAARKISLDKSSAREAAVFDRRTLEQLQAQLERPAILRFAAGKTIMQQGETGVSMYVVLEGRVAISIDGNRLEVVQPGGAFGEMALVSQTPRTASAEAREDAVLLAINRQSMIGLIKANPAFGIALLRAVAERLRHMNALLA